MAEEKNGTPEGGSCTIRYDAEKDSFDTKLEGTIPLAGLIVALETMKISLIMQQQARAMQKQAAQNPGLFGPDGMPFRR